MEIEVVGFKNWQSDWEPSQAPVDVLLRSDNLIKDAAGTRVLRPGCRRLGSQLDGPVYNIHTGYVNGLKQRFAFAGSKAYLNGAELVTLEGDGDAAVDSFLDSIFFARGASRYRHNGSSLRSWGPGEPLAPSVEAATVAEVEISSFDSGESPGWTAVAGTIADANNSDGDANEAKQVTLDKKFKSTIQRKFSSNQNYSTPNNLEEDEADMVSLAVYISDPTNSKTLTIEFGLGGEADPYKLDKFQFILPLNGVPLSRLPGAQPSVGSKFSIYNVPLQYKQEAHNKAGASLVNQTTTPQPANGTDGDEGWTVIAIPRSAFFRSGKRSTLGWNTVRAVRITYQAKKAGGLVRYDTFQIISAGKAFFGKYKIRIARFRRNGDWIEVGPPSPPSNSVMLALQGVQVNIQAGELTNVLDSVLGWDGYYVYGQGGALDVYYKLGEINALNSGEGMRIDEFSRASTNTNGFTVSERTRYVGFGFSGPGFPVSGSIASGLSAKVGADEVEVLIRNEKLEESEVPATDMIDCDHHLDRMFELTPEFLKYTPVREASRFLADLALRVGDETETPYWIRKTRSAIFVGTSKDIIRVSGTGVNNPDGTVDFELERLNVTNPPVGAGATADGNLIFYQAEDGVRLFNGESSQPIEKGGNSLLWRGHTRHGILPIATLGRCRYAVNDGYLYAVTPHGPFTGSSVFADRRHGMRIDEFAISADSAFDVYERTRFTTLGFTVPGGGASDTIWRNRLGESDWDRTTYEPNFACIYAEPDGTLLGGATDGYVYSLLHPGRADHTEAQEHNSVEDDDPIRIVKWTPSYMPNRWGRIDLNEIQAYIRSDAGAAPIAGGGGLYVDGELRSGFGISGSGDFGFWRKQFEDVEGRSFQIRSTVDAREYNLKGIKFNFMPRPPSQLRYDSGLVLPKSQEDLVWLYEMRALCRSNVNLKADLYVNDSKIDTYDITVSPGETIPYEVRFPKATKGYSCRMIIYNPVGESKNDRDAFEVYWFEMVYTNKTGNQEKMFRERVLPA